MVGCCRREPGSQQAPVRGPLAVPTVGDFVALLRRLPSNAVVDAAVARARTLVPELGVLGVKFHLGAERWVPDAHRSDHAPFWRAGVPALLWTDTAEFRNPHYHQPSDTPATLDYAFLRRVTQLLIATVLDAAR
jgi:hypothetical protein